MKKTMKSEIERKLSWLGEQVGVRFVLTGRGTTKDFPGGTWSIVRQQGPGPGAAGTPLAYSEGGREYMTAQEIQCAVDHMCALVGLVRESLCLGEEK
jgi:hypothetical protein